MMLEQPLKTIATFGWKNLFDGFTPQVIGITSWGMKFFLSVHSADSFFQKWNIVGDLRVIHSVHIVPAADFKIIIFSLVSNIHTPGQLYSLQVREKFKLFSFQRQLFFLI